MKKVLATILFTFLASIILYSQVDDSIYYNRLYYLCKVWGHVKYYHTEVAKGNVDWDDELLETINEIKNAPDNDAFNDSLLTMLHMAGEMSESTGTLPYVPDSLNNNNDHTWINDPVFSTEVKSLLNIILSKFGPQYNVYLDQALAGNPTFGTDFSHYYGKHFPSEEVRILGLFRYWNIINYFFPYKKFMDQDWDSTLKEFIPQIVESYDELSYNLAFKSLTVKINDSHAFFSSPKFNNWQGSYYPPFLARHIENEMVITKVVQQLSINVGDIIKEIDGINIYELRDSLRKYAHGSNDVIVEREINTLIMKGSSGDFTITVDNGNEINTISLNRNNSYYTELFANTTPIWRDTITDEGCNFAIVDMGKLEIEELSTMFNELWNTDAIIFDVRNYPNGTIREIVNYLYYSSIHIASFTVSDITYPGRMFWVNGYMGNGATNPYSGSVIILFDERTQSHAEYTCMGLEQFPGAIKIGSTTAAADGNISKIYLPGYMYTNATFLGTYYPDHTQTQRVGIIPDFFVSPTIQGIRDGVDEVLDFALNCDLVRIDEVKDKTDIKIYPNPTNDKIHYQITNTASPIIIKIYDMQGKICLSVVKEKSSGTIDISSLNTGIYALEIISERESHTKLLMKN